MTNPPARRTVLGTGAAAVLLAGCSKYGDNNSSSSSASPAAADGGVLAKTSDIPVGGGKIFKDKKVVVTQPKKDEFKCFSAICTHQGCTVNKVADGTIDCPCHGSKYRITDASVVHGPATRPLPAKKITVEGNSIRLA
ncbi:iron-sulfur protein [Streptomyces albiflavescens]|uniref:Cytochrome bc1 complex Rieske iron-sulfur subunit n=1 Tax=Streptomyces albiflavescens TaxID=1623582 RepID=A0A917YDZ5_9ACTN|nr:Rieske (2Fe-2S) protein [Streptomyces albiflavescens]GGN89856.1 iron-sulfur protein [Streptomyces albiflavescens]